MIDAVCSSTGQQKDKMLQGVLSGMLSQTPFQMPTSTFEVKLALDGQQANSPNVQKPSHPTFSEQDQTSSPTRSASPLKDAPTYWKPEVPTDFMNFLKDGIATVLGPSNSDNSNDRLERSNPPRDTDEPLGNSDQARLCNRPQMDADLCISPILLSPGADGGPPKYLFIAEGYDMADWDDSKTLQAQKLCDLLLKLYGLFHTKSTALNVYYDPHDRTIAFNQGDRLFYNAFSDSIYDKEEPSVRRLSWYLSICHELAHHFVHCHNSRFAEYFSHIAMHHSQAFYRLDQKMSLAEKNDSSSVLQRMQSWLHRGHMP